MRTSIFLNFDMYEYLKDFYAYEYFCLNFDMYKYFFKF